MLLLHESRQRKMPVPKCCFETSMTNHTRGTTQIAAFSRPFRLRQALCPNAAGSGRFYLRPCAAFFLPAPELQQTGSSRGSHQPPRLFIADTRCTLHHSLYGGVYPFPRRLSTMILFEFCSMVCSSSGTFILSGKGTALGCHSERSEESPFLIQNGSNGSPFPPNTFTRSDQSIQA